MRRTISIALTAVGFIAAAGAGLVLAVRVSAGEMDAGDLASAALLVFMPVALVLLAGVYLYIQDERAAETPSEESLVRKQRDLLDMLKGAGRVNLAQAAETLNVDTLTLRDMIQELGRWQVFSGYVNWQEGVLVAMQTEALRSAQDCQHCGERLDFVGQQAVRCSACGTEYFLS